MSMNDCLLRCDDGRGVEGKIKDIFCNRCVFANSWLVDGSNFDFEVAHRSLGIDITWLDEFSLRDDGCL